jgi:hypothetical protein
MKRIYLLFSIVVAIALLPVASEVRADDCPPPYPLSLGVAAPPRDCTINPISGVSVLIEAGPGAGEFPLPDTCEGGEPCLRWDYRWTVSWTGDKPVSLLDAVVSVDSDITVLKATPPVRVSKVLGIVNLGEGERFLDFTVPGLSVFPASYWTPLNASPGTLTAGFVGKKGLLPLVGRCQLAGANNVGGDLNQPVADEQSFQTPGCTVAFRVAPNGKVVLGSMRFIDPPPPVDPLICTLDESPTPIKINEKPVLFVGPTQWTQNIDSCDYSYVNTAGGPSTIKCTACCVDSRTNKCVPKATPGVVCKPGT